MKKIISIQLFILIIGICVSAQSPGELTVSASTSETGGNYAPRNILAIWVADDEGNFVKTLLAYANNRKTHLNTWQATTTAAGSAYNTVDAITGATKTSHATRNCTWDGTNVSGDLVQDGPYHLWMELTDKNSTGNFSSFAFTKGPSIDQQTPSNKPSFSSIEINWTPVVSTNDVEETVSVIIYPNPGKGIYSIQGEDVQEVFVRSITGRLIHFSGSQQIDIRDQNTGIYIAYIKTGNGIVIRNFIKY